ncbi:DUF2093 domain-containing protein [Pacificimonas sp. WHA3]|uniref:DUF2093 domain-containing protein n=1 Tax=Pacificimonas pallii TaxID=2827236 RepID=A0ABS6SEN0_9SPHN|nr:DUF2093 domain-containing protein [Pacificimonas pallii]MBV7256322.1 DUF2093 domain-containing protein [Pacificimonas pallii]
MLKLGQNKAARLDYQSGTFRVLSGGDHVVCAVTGARIDLSDLRYWSHELQEAYVSAEVASARYTEARDAGKL